MKIITNELSNKITTYISFQVEELYLYNGSYHYTPRYEYVTIGTSTCLSCGQEVIYDNGTSGEDGEATAFCSGLCDRCCKDLENQRNYNLTRDIQEFLNREALRFQKPLQKSKPRKKDCGKIKRYKIHIPKNLAKAINCFLIKQSNKQLRKYKAKKRSYRR